MNDRTGRRTTLRVCLAAALATLAAPAAAQPAAAAADDGQRAAMPAAVQRSPAINATTRRIYRAAGEKGIEVTDAATNTIIAYIPVTDAVAVAVSPMTNVVYALSSVGIVSVIDGGSNAVATTIAAGQYGFAIGIDAMLNRVYVGTERGMAVIDAYANVVMATLPGVYANPDIAVNETTHHVYAASFFEDRVSVVDGSTNTLLAAVPVGRGPVAVAVDPLTNTVYAANAATPPARDTGDTVTVINGGTNTVEATIPLGDQDAVRLTLDVAASRLVVTMSDGPAIVIDTAVNQVTGAGRRTPCDGAGGAAAPRGSRVTRSDLRANGHARRRRRSVDAWRRHLQPEGRLGRVAGSERSEESRRQHHRPMDDERGEGVGAVLLESHPEAPDRPGRAARIRGDRSDPQLQRLRVHDVQHGDRHQPVALRGDRPAPPGPGTSAITP